MTHAFSQDEMQRGNWSLWFSLLAGPIVYSLHFMLVYFVVEAACVENLLRFTWLGLNGISWVVVALTILAALLNGLAGLLAYRNWQQRKESEGGTRGSYAPFMALVGVSLNALFTVTILVTGLPALFLQPCASL